jgi:hypothetical protein
VRRPARLPAVLHGTSGTSASAPCTLLTTTAAGFSFCRRLKCCLSAASKGGEAGAAGKGGEAGAAGKGGEAATAVLTPSSSSNCGFPSNPNDGGKLLVHDYYSTASRLYECRFTTPPSPLLPPDARHQDHPLPRAPCNHPSTCAVAPAGTKTVAEEGAGFAVRRDGLAGHPAATRT